MPRSMGGAGVAGSIEFPRTVWGVIWATSTHNRNLRSGARYNVFRGLAIASTSLAIVYTVLALLIRGTISQVFLSAFSFYMVYFYLYIFASSTISNERLWLNLSIEPTRYFRYRMLARTLIMTVALLPWIAAYSIQGIYFRPAIYLAIALIPIIMSAPSLSWLAAAYVGVPQRRELQLVQRPVTHSLRIYLIFLVLFITLAIYMTPYSLALVTIYYPRLSILGLIGDAFTALILAASTVFFYYAVVSERGRGMWAWLVNRLSEFGYV
ncbi:hypothetical protein [Vulcanisaeta sp. JCM 16159]|uniref:hypothetical protein n=1 Tax=Vulcanisaeta sp. JCM 16159 TaxID=1295371 RepID=UPI001FB2D2AA|nr:hypothetical protein [Vulcanisaeta sp. JCM 16159]